jgi:hypothetical protein
VQVTWQNDGNLPNHHWRAKAGELTVALYRSYYGQQNIWSLSVRFGGLYVVDALELGEFDRVEDAQAAAVIKAHSLIFQMVVDLIAAMHGIAEPMYVLMARADYDRLAVPVADARNDWEGEGPPPG